MKLSIRSVTRASVVAAFLGIPLAFSPLTGHIQRAAACGATSYYNRSSDGIIGANMHYDSCSQQVSVDAYYSNGISSPGCPEHVNAKLFVNGNVTANVDSGCGGNSTSTGYRGVTNCANTSGSATDWYGFTGPVHEAGTPASGPVDLLCNSQ